MKRPRRVTFRVSFELPEDATVAEARDYVRLEVTGGCGGLHPDEPMHHLNRSSVQVVSLRQNRSKAT